MSGSTVTFKVHRARGAESRIELRAGEGPAVAPTSPGRTPRVAKLMALALRFDRLVRSAEVRDFAEIARLGHVTRARVTQIMNLLNLAPDIQEELLFLSRVESGDDPLTEQDLRPVCARMDWEEQRALWRRLRPVSTA